MQKQQKTTPKAVPQQRFFVPQHAPFLEIRTTLHSEIPYAEHFHSSFSLGLILQGATRFSVGTAEHRAKTGDIVLIAQGQAHSCNPVGGPRGYHMLLIDVAWLGEDITAELAACPPLIRDAALFSRAATVVDAMLADCDNIQTPHVQSSISVWLCYCGECVFSNQTEQNIQYPLREAYAVLDPPNTYLKKTHCWKGR